MPKYWKSKVLLAGIETGGYAVDPTLTGAANAILAMNVTFTPQEGEVVQRNLERPFFAANPFVAMAFRSQISFEVDLVGSGEKGVAPAWGPLIRMCAVAETVTTGEKVEYIPITDDQESGALYFDVDGIKHIMLGARGTAVKRLNATGNPVIAFTITSKWTAPLDAARPVPEFTAWQAPQAASTVNTPVFTVGGKSFVMRSYEFDLGCQVEPRNLIGFDGILITGKENERLTATVEAVAMATYNPGRIAELGTLQPIILKHGTIPGRIVQIEHPAAQQMPLPQYQQQQGILEWSLPFVPQAIAGNDQWKMTLT